MGGGETESRALTGARGERKPGWSRALGRSPQLGQWEPPALGGGLSGCRQGFGLRACHLGEGEGEDIESGQKPRERGPGTPPGCEERSRALSKLSLEFLTLPISISCFS